MDNIDLNKAVRAAAMLATYHTTAWSGRCKDAVGAAAAAAATGADARAYSTYKNLMYGSDERLKKLTNIQTQGRKLHLESTLPWGGEHERGLRMLPVVNWQPYMKAIAGVKKEFGIALQDFLDHYDKDAAKAQARLKITNPVDLYPTKSELASMFSMRPAFTPIPEGAQFQGLPAGVCERLADSYENRMREQFQRASRAALERAAEALETFAKRLEAATNTVYASTWQIILDLPSVVDGFNVIQQQEITDISNRIKRELVGQYDLQMLRDSEANRKQASSRAAKIAADIRNSF